MLRLFGLAISEKDAELDEMLTLLKEKDRAIEEFHEKSSEAMEEPKAQILLLQQQMTRQVTCLA